MTHPTPHGRSQTPQGLRMPAVNQVQIAGRLKFDPEYRITDAGRRRSTFRLEVTRSWRDRDGEWLDEACYFNVVAFDEVAENIGCYARKRTPVFVTGGLFSETVHWDSQPHSLVQIIARAVQVLEKDVPDPEPATAATH